MFIYPMRAAGRICGANEKQMECLTAYARAFGLLFQATDDLLDVVGTSEEMGKTLGKDAASGKLRVPVFWGAWETDMESAVVVKWLREIVEKAPYHDMAATASSILAKYLVDQDRPEEARVEYARLVEKYPDSRYAPEAQLMVAQLWANSHTRGDNNLVNLSNAREAYEEFTLRFPNHPEAKKALSEASNMDRLMVQQQLEVGRYYLERSREYTSAIFCLQDVIRQKSINPEAAKEAEVLLEKARVAAENAKTES
jgi:tetratricopeptide (TPR) repeat protein